MSTSSDFGSQISGGGTYENIRVAAKSFFDEYTMAVLLVIVVMFIWIIITTWGWSLSGKKEGILSCMPGNDAALCRQGRDGPGEGLENGVLAQGFGANPQSFCANAGEATTDPQDYLRLTSLQSSEGENLSPYASPTDRFDQNLMIAMQH